MKNLENLENVKAILENLPDPIVVVNDSVIEYKNTKFISTFTTSDILDPVFVNKVTGIPYVLKDAA